MLIPFLATFSKAYSKEQLTRANEVRRLHYALLHPTDAVLIKVLKYGLLWRTRQTVQDIYLYRLIFGACPCLAGKTTSPSYTSSLSPPALMTWSYCPCRSHTILVDIDYNIHNIIFNLSRSRPQHYVSDAYHHSSTCCHGDYYPDNETLSDPTMNLSSAIIKCPGSTMHGYTR